MPAPKVEIGDLVWWYVDGNPHEKPQAAVVTAIGMDSLCLNIITCDNMAMRIRDAVLHLSDPRCGGEHVRDGGGWDLTPREKQYRDLLSDLKGGK